MSRQNVAACLRKPVEPGDEVPPLSHDSDFHSAIDLEES